MFVFDQSPKASHMTLRMPVPRKACLLTADCIFSNAEMRMRSVYDQVRGVKVA